ncbi:MAG: hypothetical protein ACRC7C_04245 [Beijerinckiaceae bacterium]
MAVAASCLRLHGLPSAGDRHDERSKVDTMTVDETRLHFQETEPSPRAALVAQWNILTRDILPGMAERYDWPISNDHCFMRVCLDSAMGAPWHLHVKRPAIRHLSDAQLASAISIAEALVSAPETLKRLNRQSTQWRNATSCKDSQL